MRCRPLILLLVACTSRPSVRDAGVADSGSLRDTGTSDAGDAAFEDAALEDGAIEDAAIEDAAIEDAAIEDAGPGPDSGQSVVLFRVHVPDNTPSADLVHITGDFQAWDPASTAHALASAEDGVHEITLRFDPGTSLAFKLTRGSWATVEKGPSGEEIPNRTYVVGGSATEYLEVATWADVPAAVDTRTGDVHTLSVPGFLAGRRVWVYLPPGYHTGTDRYSVLYMADGQNVFDATTSFSGEWEVDETLEALIATTEVRPMIVVAVDNGGGARIDEYTPWVDTGVGAGGMADAHLDAIRNVLIPYVDATYRTLTGPSNTGISGSSLGGLLTLYATYAHPDVFGRNGALSPSIWWDDREVLTFAAASAKPPSIVWMDIGTGESASAVTNVEDMRDLMVGQGFVLGTDLQVYVDPGAGHDEAAWASRFPDVLRFLFPGP